MQMMMVNRLVPRTASFTGHRRADLTNTVIVVTRYFGEPN